MKATLTAFIPLEKHAREQAIEKNETDLLIDAAWHFAYSALWHHEIISPKEITNCKEFIRHFFQLQVNSKKALIIFCERVLLAKEYFVRYPGQLSPPSIWLHHQNDEGFTTTLTWYQQMLVRRQQVPDFRNDLQIVTHYYLQYAVKPSAKWVKDCRNQLMRLKANDLLQIFYNSIIHIQYSN